jgi:hypothetical protein
MIPDGGTGDAHRTEDRYLVQPLPPVGPLTFICEWPAFDIPETRVSTTVEN